MPHCIATHDFWGRWDCQQAHKMESAALELDPNDAEVNECMAEIYTALGDFSVALQHIDRSLKSDPLSPNHFYTKANIYYHLGQLDTALALLAEALTLDRTFGLALHLQLACLIQKGDKAALIEAEKPTSDIDLPMVFEVMFDLYHRQGPIDKDMVLNLVRELQEITPSPLMAWDLFLLAQVDPHQAMDLLSKRAKMRMGQVVNFKHEKYLAPLRQFSQFGELVAQNFPAHSLESNLDTAQVSVKPLMTEEETVPYLDTLSKVMEEESVYLDINLNLKALAETIGLHPNKLSWLINEKIGKNFSDFINGYRLAAFQRKAIAPDFNHLTLLGLAYESGFTSKSVFNDFFKKQTGMTPKAWVKLHKSS